MANVDVNIHNHDHDHDHDHDHIILLTDEEGVETEFEIIADFSFEDQEYAVLFPLHGDEEDTAYIFKVVEEGEEAFFENLDDATFERVSQHYYELLEEE